MKSKHEVLISIVTRPRLHLLRGAVKSLLLAGAGSPDSEFSIVVVENSGDKATVEQFLAQLSDNPKVISCSKRGIPFARNAALDFASKQCVRGVLFLDDDQIISKQALELLRDAAVRTQYREFLKCNVVRANGSRDYENDHQTSVTGTGGLFIPSRAYAGSDGMRFLESWPSDGGTDAEFTARATSAGYSIKVLSECEVQELEHSKRQRATRRVWSAARRGQTWLLISHLYFDKPLTRQRRIALLGDAIRRLPRLAFSPDVELVGRVIAYLLTALGVAIREYTPPRIARLRLNGEPFGSPEPQERDNSN